MSFEWSFVRLRQPIKLDDKAYSKSADVELESSSTSALTHTPSKSVWPSGGFPSWTPPWTDGRIAGDFP